MQIFYPQKLEIYAYLCCINSKYAEFYCIYNLLQFIRRILFYYIFSAKIAIFHKTSSQTQVINLKTVSRNNRLQ